MILVAVIALLLAGTSHWQLTRQKDWEVRFAKVEGEDVIVATGMEVRKLLLKLPAGTWNITVDSIAHSNGKQVSTQFGGGTFAVSGGDVIPIWFYVRDNDVMSGRVTFRGGSMYFATNDFGEFTDPTPNGICWELPSARITPGTPFRLYGRTWGSARGGFSMSSLSTWPRESGDDIILRLTVNPAAPSARVAPNTPPPSTKTNSVRGDGGDGVEGR
jgi:hypothetical protein